MINWIDWNRTDFFIKMDLALNNLQRSICHTTQPTNQLNICTNDHNFSWEGISINLNLTIERNLNGTSTPDKSGPGSYSKKEVFWNFFSKLVCELLSIVYDDESVETGIKFR